MSESRKRSVAARLARLAAAEREARIVGRVAMLRLEHHDNGADLDAAIEVDGILVGQADAARRDRGADIFRLVGAVNAEQRVLAAGVEIHRAGAHRIVRTRCHESWNAETRDFARGRMPSRPLGLAA